MSDPSSSLQYVRSSVIYLQYVLSLHLFVFNVPIPPCFVQQYGFSLHLFLFSVSSRRSFLFSVSSPSDFSSSVCLIPPLLSLQYVLSSDRSSSVHSSSVCPTPPVLSLQCVRPLHLSVFSMSEPSSFFSSVALPFLSSVCPFQHSFCPCVRSVVFICSAFHHVFSNSVVCFSVCPSPILFFPTICPSVLCLPVPLFHDSFSSMPSSSKYQRYVVSCARYNAVCPSSTGTPAVCPSSTWFSSLCPPPLNSLYKFFDMSISVLAA